jgi:hypothetical protein
LCTGGEKYLSLHNSSLDVTKHTLLQVVAEEAHNYEAFVRDKGIPKL